MYFEVRIGLILLALAAAAVTGSLARKAGLGSLTVLRSWTRTEGVITAMPAADYVEIELGREPETRRVVVAPPHQIGLWLFKRVPVYLDPADPTKAQVGGALQLWLWPAGLALATVVLLGLGVSAARAGEPLPPPLQTDIRVYPPASEWTAPLVFSLVGAAAMACGLLIRSGGMIPRTILTAIGVGFLLFMWALALDSKTLEISADDKGLRRTSAFGWKDVPWGDIARFEKIRTTPMTRRRNFLGYDMPFPGRDTESYSFAGRNGRTLIRLSIAMHPADAMLRLFDLCAARTGLHPEKRTIRILDF